MDAAVKRDSKYKKKNEKRELYPAEIRLLRFVYANQTKRDVY